MMRDLRPRQHNGVQNTRLRLLTFSPHTNSDLSQKGEDIVFLKNVLKVKNLETLADTCAEMKQSILHDKEAAQLRLHTVVLLLHFQCDTRRQLKEVSKSGSPKVFIFLFFMLPLIPTNCHSKTNNKVLLWYLAGDLSPPSCLALNTMKKKHYNLMRRA